MYILDAYNTSDRDKIVQFIEANSFADLITCREGSLCSNKVPLFYDKEKNELLGHFGSSNSQLIDIENSDEVLVLFSGAHAYISPLWYESNNGVPTWNFQAVQVRGAASIVDDISLMEILEKLSKFHESNLPNPWSMDQLDAEKRDIMLNMITGFKIEITDIKFKEKMSQLRSRADQQGIISALEKKSEQAAREVAGVMSRNLRLT